MPVFKDFYSKTKSLFLAYHARLYKSATGHLFIGDYKLKLYLGCSLGENLKFQVFQRGYQTIQ